MASRDLDYSPLTGRLALGARLRAMTGDNMKLVGMTVLALVTLGFGIAFIVVVVSGRLFSGFGPLHRHVLRRLSPVLGQ